MGKLTVLGAGDAFASGGKYCTSFFIEAAGQRILLDCGATAFVRYKQLNRQAKDLDMVVLTHFHGDHYGGLPFFVISAKVEQAREKPLLIVGPKGVKEKVYLLQEAMYPGTGALLDELPFAFKEYEEDWNEYLQGIEVSAFPMKHSPPSNPHGVRLRWNENILSFSGDTEWSDNLPLLAERSEIMICECNNLDQESPGHLSYQTLLSKKELLSTNRLLLSHMGPEMLAATGLEFEKLQDGQVIDLW
ncbi:MAG: MBL fold metallo-hydrolase [Cytophagales bacterium]|nr:MBL fold metallo-hydrolase [Cytophagales bacterium]